MNHKLTMPAWHFIHGFAERYYFGIFVCFIYLSACSNKEQFKEPDLRQTTAAYFDADSSWYLDNIPFFECSDKEIEAVYHYRWEMYKAHLRNTGTNSFVITEFINHVPWDREPWCTINAASMHHIYEGRWLRDQRFMQGYIDYLYQQGGNDRRYSESVADAAYANFLVTADTGFIIHQLDSMIRDFDGWSDHFDSSKQLYFIPAMPDATEYNIASIDASGGKGGFEGGDAFRPTINSYMYGNAKAIAKIALLAGRTDIYDKFSEIATDLKTRVENNLWNDSLMHFTDRYKVNNSFVHYWDFIRGRELAGMAPWYFNLPADQRKFNTAWNHVLDTAELLGKYGFRTNEPSYEYYFKQFVWFEGQRGSQWNGPSWPYQSSMALTAMVNLLQNYSPELVTPADYVDLLQRYTRQHYLPNGKINLVENYEPNLGGPIVYFYWSNHYNHSSYNNLVISGLCGIIPSEDDSLELFPLINDSISYFALTKLPYHGHELSVIYDRDGNHYQLGKGLSVFVDGEKQTLSADGKKQKVYVGKALPQTIKSHPANLALNISRKEYPRATASVNNHPDSLFQAVDGKTWYFPEIRNWWSTWNSTNNIDWFGLDFGESKELSAIVIKPLFVDGRYMIPDSISINYLEGNEWKPVKILKQNPEKLTGNTSNRFGFDPVKTNSVRIYFYHGKIPVALTEVEIYGQQ